MGRKELEVCLLSRLALSIATRPTPTLSLTCCFMSSPSAAAFWAVSTRPPPPPYPIPDPRSTLCFPPCIVVGTGANKAGGHEGGSIVDNIRLRVVSSDSIVASSSAIRLMRRWRNTQGFNISAGHTLSGSTQHTMAGKWQRGRRAGGGRKMRREEEEDEGRWMQLVWLLTRLCDGVVAAAHLGTVRVPLSWPRPSIRASRRSPSVLLLACLGPTPQSGLHPTAFHTVNAPANLSWARNYDHAEATQERTEKRDVTGHDLLLLLSTIVPPLLASGWLAVWTRRVHCGSTTAALVGH
jgi:hypothetical protein